MSCIGNFRPSTIPLKSCPKAISCPVLLLIYKRRFCKAAFCAAIFMFVASLMTIVAICIIQPPLPPPTGDKWRPVSWSQVLLQRSQESKSTVDILLRGWKAYRSSAGTPKEITLVRMSARLLVDARLHVSFSFPFLFSFPFTLYRKLEKNTPIPSTVIFFVETCVVWNKGETSFATLRGNRQKLSRLQGVQANW